MTMAAEKLAPQVRIFAHSSKDYPTKDDLMAWLLNGLRGRGGEYRLTTAHRVKYLPPGSVVLFRYADEIVGEAVVSKEKEIVSGEEYAAQVTLAPSSIRLYSPPLPINRIQQLYPEKDISSSAQPYYILPWESYSHILKEVVTAGVFIGS